jgi:hypothetical protein
MANCQTCNQPIKESVLEGRKLIAQVHTGPHAPPTMGRYLTIFSFKCGCGERVERRYESRLLATAVDEQLTPGDTRASLPLR